MAQSLAHRSTKILAGIFLASTALAGCGESSDNLDEPSLTANTTSSESSTSEQPSSSSPREAKASESEKDSAPESEPASERKSEPTFAECYEANAALLSDGSVVTDTINCGVEEEPKQPSEPAAPAEPECTGGAAECGYGYDEEGNPNPSSGELQTQWGCEQGYITDPELCAAVSEL